MSVVLQSLYLTIAWKKKYPVEFKKDSQVTLDGTNTETFVRYRDINVHQSAITRMERQSVYLSKHSRKPRRKKSRKIPVIQ